MVKYFSLPCFYQNFYAIQLLMNYMKKYPDYFYQDRVIDSFYDADPSLAWRGGRSKTYMFTKPPKMESILDYFNKYPNIKLRHVFTNCLLDEELIHNEHCNEFVQKYIRPQDEVILNSPLLIQHFKTNYPQIPIVYSTTLDIKDIDQVNALSKNNVYVLNYNYNIDDEYLKQLTHKENIEILCGELCIPNCPFRKVHYTYISKVILGIPLEENEFEECYYQLHPEKLLDVPPIERVTNNRIEELSEQGFKYFKISGRGITINLWWERVLYYLALPKYYEILKRVLPRMQLNI